MAVSGVSCLLLWIILMIGCWIISCDQPGGGVGSSVHAFLELPGLGCGVQLCPSLLLGLDDVDVVGDGDMIGWAFEYFVFGDVGLGDVEGRLQFLSSLLPLFTRIIKYFLRTAVPRLLLRVCLQLRLLEVVACLVAHLQLGADWVLMRSLLAFGESVLDVEHFVGRLRVEGFKFVK